MSWSMPATKIAVSLLIAVPLATGTANSTRAQDDCHDTLWSVPVETLNMPDGWDLLSATPQPQGWWNVEMTGPDGASVSAQLFCIVGITAFAEAMDRTGDLQGTRALAVVEVGDQTWASRETPESTAFFSGMTEITWVNGSILGVVSDYSSEDEAADWEDMEDIALALDSLLP